ncbi:MAG TPA: hypothetical protein VGN57_16000 [Pirellulaceae bacterium]|jgi:hypothetical protein|nr:hypothetical protein [Pirellulaceae bacterium]
MAGTTVKQEARDDDLLRRFMERASKLEGLRISLANADPDDLLPGLKAGQDDSPSANALWKPWQAPEDFRPLDPAYAAFPLRFPPLYERWATRYRWLEFHVPELATFYENASEVPLESVLRRIASLKEFSRRLLVRGMLPFGAREKGPIDPLCFDTRQRRRDSDCPVVRVNHEAVILQDDHRAWQTWPVAESFREFVEMAIERLNRVR